MDWTTITWVTMSVAFSVIITSLSFIYLCLWKHFDTDELLYFTNRLMVNACKEKSYSGKIMTYSMNIFIFFLNITYRWSPGSSHVHTRKSSWSEQSGPGSFQCIRAQNMLHWGLVDSCSFLYTKKNQSRKIKLFKNSPQSSSLNVQCGKFGFTFNWFSFP